METETNTDAPVVRVLFVCLGNICRSPMAEAIFDHKLKQAGLFNLVETDSAGTGNYHEGDRADSRTLQTLVKYGLAETQHSARQITAADFEHFDYILTMDDQNHTNTKSVAEGRAVVEPMLTYAPKFGTEVPDPYYNDGFDVCV